MTTSPLAIDVFSDVVCPWCFIGKRRLEKAVALRPDIPVEVHYRPYFLNPWVPREGMSRVDYLTAKFGSPERYEKIALRVAQAAANEGLTYNIGALARQPNTLDCHRLILWGGRFSKSARVKQRLMEIYFSEGGDLSDRDVLVQAASDCGLDPVEVRALLDSDADVAAVEQAAKSAQEAGIEGVPFYVFGNVLAVSGAQATEYLAGAIERAANELAKSAA
ncbi:MAG TPA: DsbA family oxidoreductase [Xanthobacteraceae bacterium]|nr:DsbA family oxidoreductase [Xanthobacteraceae bacterium]